MDQTAIYKLGLRRDVELSAKVEVELTSTLRSEPLLVVLNAAKESAAEAIAALVYVDAADHAEIRRLQNEVRRFDDLVKWLHELLIAGPEAERQLNDLQMQEARGLVIDEQTAQQLGLPTNGATDDD
jgi:metal-sulfur cluster biosynthetic enzyme